MAAETLDFGGWVDYNGSWLWDACVDAIFDGSGVLKNEPQLDLNLFAEFEFYAVVCCLTRVVRMPLSSAKNNSIKLR